jgi:hypothetical protein
LEPFKRCTPAAPCEFSLASQTTLADANAVTAVVVCSCTAALPRTAAGIATISRMSAADKCVPVMVRLKATPAETAKDGIAAELKLKASEPWPLSMEVGPPT